MAAPLGTGRGAVLAELLLGAGAVPAPDPLDVGSGLGGVPVLVPVTPVALVYHLERVEASRGDFDSTTRLSYTFDRLARASGGSADQVLSYMALDKAL